jgi:DNA polymerase sigma
LCFSTLQKKQTSSNIENADNDDAIAQSDPPVPSNSNDLKEMNDDSSIQNQYTLDTKVSVSTNIDEDGMTKSRIDNENVKPAPFTPLDIKAPNTPNDNVTSVVTETESETKDDLNDNDGWETVEHKATVRSKRASANTKLFEKNSQNQPANGAGNATSGRKRKGHRRRNRNREKDSGRSSQEVVESGTIVSTNKGAGDKKPESERPLAHGLSKGAQFTNGTVSSQQIRPLKDVLMSNLPKDDIKNINTPMKLADAVRANMKSSRTAVTDQTTASTGPDTISAASKSRPITDESARPLNRTSYAPLKKLNEPRFEASMTQTKENSCGSSSTDETSTRKTILMTKNSVPPFSTLVGPSNMNSANSSVASSLEAPHATRYGVHHHHQKSPKEDDVGYHLLKVCEKLSSDMDIFMSRRALALNVRRRERRDLLASLQETVHNIWPSRCKVEMYGSCATRLDLPSSDLDVVVCGLDRMDPSIVPTQEISELGTGQSFSPRHGSPNASYHHQHYIPLSVNGKRVLRLAAALEKVSWAVQVKPIPTASVPVIKILADPSRLEGSQQVDWMLHQQHLAVAAAEMNCPKITPHQQESKPDQRNSEGQSRFCASGAPPNTTSFQNTWRGADVMNGLLSLDITFEGPEHGGLGSTAFSARIVQEACNETGLPPESTPAVKVLMVIKEMLAQRRLNEPFSGGLSSYAILLLVVAVIKERRIIRREMDRVERQQLAVTSQSVGAHSQSLGNSIKNGSTPPSEKKSSVSPELALTKKTSWAAIAMKSSDTIRKDNALDVEPMSQDSSNPKSTDLEISSAMNARDDDVDESIHDTTLFPQGSNDVLEVLCSGEPTAGKLLMHFLLFYGRHFDATTTCIDVSGTHHPDYKKARNKLQTISHLSPYVNRKPGGTYNPTTDVYTVDPIIIYDPLEGSESNNVSRTCYAWENIRWTFEQCYNTLSGVVELGVGSRNDRNRSKSWPVQVNGQAADPDDLSVQPLLELLLSF